MEDNPISTISFMSKEINEISAALSAFQGEIEQPALNRENPYFKSRYVDLSGVLKAVQKSLANNGLSVAQIIVGGDIVTLLSHKSGQWLKSVCPIGNYKSQQDRGSAITYTKRYAICAMLGIAADTDDDGNSATDADKKNGGVNTGQSQINKAMFTGEQLTEALAELDGITDESAFSDLWAKWQKKCPAMCHNGTEFYKAACRKSQSIKASAKQ